MLSKRLSNITPSFTIGISSKIKKLKEKELNIINLSIGEPDFFTPDRAKEEAIKAIHNNKTKYDLASGLNELKKVIQNKLLSENEIYYEVDEIVVSNGAKHSITNSLLALLDEGDEVIIPKPYWVSYPEMVKLVGGKPIFVDTDKSNNFKVTVGELKKIVNTKTKAIIISNPSNPVGIIYREKELIPIVEFCLENNIYIISDEIYEKICYIDDYKSTAAISDEAKDITITINGLSKSASMTGWRVGYSASNREIADAISTIQGHLISHPSTISQWAAFGALSYCEEEMKAMVKIYKGRRDKAVSILKEIEPLSFIYPEGAFYLFIDISQLKQNMDYNGSFSVYFADRLLEESKVAVVPGIAFGMDDYIRISYACSTDELIEGLNRIAEFVHKIKNE
ncbi:aspartate aminotransferase [Caloranaerobacter azorensis DSM 13643]|uniref:Aminotransferase n=1 Tax=Caloranaerobacter azorensis DSM 13643 TaxID=1121264 RepID=A0A1M5U7B9_9FIRM|nr:pyridoxal phosphate-dependent aminotransferase [Caloranaerobacter azorensis]SHH58942.1 aspartate aminotransferase [Caloranaerobacter azorensis DSM 13643]